MSSKGVYRGAGAVAAAAAGMLLVWNLHVGAQERLGREIRREVGAEQARGGATQAARASHHRSYDECANACAACQRVCDSCAAHCLGLVAEGKKEHQQTLQTCLDCAEICAAANRIVSRSGPFSDTICRACAEACDRCAKACEQFPSDEYMAQCAKECRTCQKACEAMLSHGARSAQAGQTDKSR